MAAETLGIVLFYLIAFGIWAMFVYLTYYFAKIKNRNTTLAIILGVLTGIWAFLVYWLAVTKKGSK